jgi:NAD(P)-dependent dehydrogenase (short-subunit alcohol dehydrogenase family)
MFISGAARGIGRAIAERFLSADWRVGLFDIDATAAAEAAAGRDNAASGSLDVRDESQWRRALGEFCGDGGLDVLVNNAGVLASGPFTDTDLQTHRWIVEVNVIGVVNGCAEGHSYLRRSGQGLLLNLCSASALYGQPSLATYAATKAAVKSLTEALELEWMRDGIRVRSLLPLFVDTDMVTHEAAGVPSVERLGVRLTPEDVAATAWSVVHERSLGLRSLHRPVGAQTRLFAIATAISPEWATRLVVSRITRPEVDRTGQPHHGRAS